MKKRKKPLRNYIILGAICLVTVFLVIYLCLWYQRYQEYESGIPVLRGVVPEIKDEELPHYVKENSRAIVYLCVPSNEECRYFENNLVKLLEKDDLKDSIIYLNLSTDAHAEVTLVNLMVQYNIMEDLTNYPAFLLFENGEVVKVLQGKTNASLSLGEVENFLDFYEIN